jgi:aryl-alcohol dehydrogenase-like predicted oxidoreductase
MGDGPNDTGLTRKHILTEVDKSLERLCTDYIDLYQAHCFDRSTPLDETLKAFDDLVRWGKVRYIGASNYTPSALQSTLSLASCNRWARFVSLQPEYSLLVRSTEWELIPLCREQGRLLPEAGLPVSTEGRSRLLKTAVSAEKTDGMISRSSARASLPGG